MQQDSDFAAYLAARWPALVRTVVLLGCPRPEAEDVVRDALARCHRGWERERHAGDIDARVHEALLEAVARAAGRRTVWPHPGLGQPQPVLDLVPALDRLTPPVRAALVLEAVAGLEPDQLARLLGTTPGTSPAAGRPGPAEVRDAAAAIDVLAPPIDAVVATARDHRRRELKRIAGATAAVLVLVGLGAWAGTRPPPAPAADRPHVTRAQNLAEVAWWANGVLHLPRVEVELPRVTDLVEVGDGAVIGDEQGDVSWVGDDGEVTRIGHKVPLAPLVASDQHGWAAWVDPGSPGVTRLIVWDLAAGQELAHLDVAAHGPLADQLEDGPHPVAIDGTRLYYAAADGEWSWQLPDGERAGLGIPALLADSHGTRATARGSGVHVEQSTYGISFDVAGTGAQLSPAGEYLLTHQPTADNQVGTPRIYDTRTGDQLWTGLEPGDLAVAASLGPDDEVTYVVAHAADQPQAGEFVRQSFSGPYELRTCHLGERTCFTVTKFPHTGALPVLAH
ncbi:hypothetical protein [Nocardioides sp. LS1]|uniref:hypothetical protein n=1 Tax=Nocardioides sp. LS1 TaxID=1027620 RepID=UPI000F6198F4|nr:hypothetical protein [Nocardioides sp. LS1]GCD88677.1 hypothetical protein NLS1_06830 [Nocardioides sp. LS1]